MGVVPGSHERPGSQPPELVRLADPGDPFSPAVALLLLALACLVAVGISHLLGTADVTRLDWADLGLGAVVLAGVGGIGALRTVTQVTDRLDATVPVASDVQVGEDEPSASRARQLGRELWRAGRLIALMVVAIAFFALLEDGDANRWAIAGCGLCMGVGIQVVVRECLTVAHERAERVRIYKPEDEDEWYEQTTGKELGATDPGPLFHAEGGERS